MPSIRMEKNIFPFFDSTKNPISEAGTSDSFHNNGYDSMVLEVSGATAIAAKVQECVNILDQNGNVLPDSSCVWTDMAVIKASDFDVSNNISANGIYYVSISGSARVRVVVTSITGSATITGVAGL